MRLFFDGNKNYITYPKKKKSLVGQNIAWSFTVGLDWFKFLVVFPSKFAFFQVYLVSVIYTGLTCIWRYRINYLKITIAWCLMHLFLEVIQRILELMPNHPMVGSCSFSLFTLYLLYVTPANLEIFFLFGFWWYGTEHVQNPVRFVVSLFLVWLWM